MDKKKMMKIPEIAELIGKSRSGVYNKLRYGLGHEVKDGTIYTCLEWLEEYDLRRRRGRRAKKR